MIRNKNIICFAPSDWNWKTYGSCKRFMNIFASENKVLYINHIPFSTPNIRKVGTSVFVKRLKRRLYSTSQLFSKTDNNIHIFTPLIFPPYKKSIKKLNNFLVLLQIRCIQKFLSLSKPIVWIENPTGIAIAKSLKPELIIYYRTDKFESHSELSKSQDMLSYEDKLTLDADLIFCVSLKLYEEKLKYRQKNVYYLPHGVDFHHFYRATRALPLPDDIKPIKPPIVGYFGSLTNRNDQSIIEYCATKRPDFSFVLLGQVLGNYQFLQNLPNVHFLGYKDYAKLPNYGKAFDVCIMFWKTSEWIEYCNPVKTMEYLAMGKPVVSVPIAEISRKFHGLISIANSPEQFLRKIEEELRNNNLSKQKERTQFVTNETWNARALQISEIITNYTIQ